MEDLIISVKDVGENFEILALFLIIYLICNKPLEGIFAILLTIWMFSYDGDFNRKDPIEGTITIQEEAINNKKEK